LPYLEELTLHEPTVDWRQLEFPVDDN
jgi:hypothetical protein